MSKMKADPIYRLAGLLHDIGKSKTKSYGFTGLIHFNRHEKVGAEMAEEILTRLKYPNATIKSIKNAILNHMRFKQSSLPSNHSLRKFVNEIGTEDDFNLCLDLIDADNKSHSIKHCKPNQVEQIKKRIAKLEEQESSLKVNLPINGKEIMEIFNWKKGPKIGQALKILTEYYYISPKMTKDEAIKVIQRAVEKGDIKD